MRCAVLGSPIAHSLSPAMHRAAYAVLGLNDWTYDALEVSAGGLAVFLDGLDAGEWAGLSITAPLKREAAAYAVTRSDVVAWLGVANTLIGGPDGWHATNTDVPGAVSALRERGIDSVESVRFLGGGATVDSIRLAVEQLGAKRVEIWVRDPAKFGAESGVEVRQLGEPITDKVDLLVSTIPGDAVPDDATGSADAVFDVTYEPWPTPLAQAAESSGLRFISGLDLLAHQAALQVALMTGRDVDEVSPDQLRISALGSLSG